MTDQALAIVPQKHSIINNFDDLSRAATAMSKSGYFSDSREQAQAIVKIMAGQEMGFGPFASMTGIYIIQGRPSIGANLMAAAVKGSRRYNYRVTEMSEKACSIDFYEGGEKIGNSTFTIEDARKAETKNTQKYARNMLFARAMSNGVRWYCPDVFNGSAVYTPEELGADVDGDGNVVAGSWKEAEPQDAQPEPEAQKPVEQPKPAQPPAPRTTSGEPFTLEDCQNMQTSDGKLYGSLTKSELLTHLNGMLKDKNPSEDRLLKIEKAKRLLQAYNKGELPEIQAQTSLMETASSLGGQPA